MCDIKITFWVSEMSIDEIMEGVKGNSTKQLDTFLYMRGQFSIIHLINYPFSGQIQIIVGKTIFIIII